ncbi:MAG: putative beta-lysine N-acetyltransferase [Chloroflexota bacterium]
MDIGKSLAQHGSNNDRVYLMNLDTADAEGMPETLNAIAARENYGKISVKVPERFREIFSRAGYDTEATVPGLYRGRETGYFMRRFLDDKRAVKHNASLVADVLKKALAKETAENIEEVEPYVIRPCAPDDAPAMAELYRDVFLTYPFPIDKPEYIISTMEDHISYFGAWFDGKLVALSSAEQYPENRFVEMTDFATLPSHQGKGIASLLLNVMEKAMREKGFLTSYTSARAASYGMNGVFSKAGYQFGGTLVNNTCISGHIEHMNIWYKPL